MKKLRLILVLVWTAGCGLLLLIGVNFALQPIVLIGIVLCGYFVAVVGIIFKLEVLSHLALWIWAGYSACLVFFSQSPPIAPVAIMISMLCWDLNGYLLLPFEQSRVHYLNFLQQHLFRLFAVGVISYLLIRLTLQFQLKIDFLVYILLILIICVGLYGVFKLLTRTEIIDRE